MKPKPFWSLNHLTLPVAMTDHSFPWTRAGVPCVRGFHGADSTTCAERTNGVRPPRPRCGSTALTNPAASPSRAEMRIPRARGDVTEREDTEAFMRRQKRMCQTSARKRSAQLIHIVRNGAGGGEPAPRLALGSGIA